MEAIFSSINRITINRLTLIDDSKKLCCGVFGFQTDCQCLGYDYLCAIAAILQYEMKLDSYQAVYKAREEIQNSLYSEGFQHAWDDDLKKKDDYEYIEGHKDGRTCKSQFKFQSRKLYNDFVLR